MICPVCGSVITTAAARFCGKCGTALQSTTDQATEAIGSAAAPSTATIPKWQDLERRIAGFFGANGYVVTLNDIREGASGGRHEIDVLAKKSDGIADFSLAIECKAWQSPIEKDVVSKLSYVMSDLGINKGLIVSLSGWTDGAELSAKRLGIDLWGPQEITDRLGVTAIPQLENATSCKIVGGLAPLASSDHVSRLLQSQTRGMLGIVNESIVWTRLIWVPFYLLDIKCSKWEKERFRKAELRITPVWNFYNAIDGTFYVTATAPPPTQQQMAEGVVLPRIKDRQVRNSITQALDKRGSVVTDSARQRYAAKLTALGIPSLTERLSIDAVSQMYIPFYATLVTRHGKNRILAIDAHAGQLSESLGSCLTSNLSYVLACVDGSGRTS